MKVDVLGRVPLEDIFTPGKILSFYEHENPAQAITRIPDGDAEIFPVLNIEGVMTGMIGRDALRTAALELHALPLLVVGDLMTPPRYLQRGIDLHQALSIFLDSAATQLPVVDEALRPVGMVRMHDILREYDRRTRP